MAVGFAELGDKTQLSLMLLSMKSKSRLHLLAGAVLGFLIVDGVAVLAGSWVTGLVGEDSLKLMSGLVFIALGLQTLLRRGEEGEVNMDSKGTMASAFTLILVAEWGDKTQVASALLATRYNPVMVLSGALASLTFVSMLAVYAGGFISKRIGGRLLARLAAVTFILAGLLMILL